MVKMWSDRSAYEETHGLIEGRLVDLHGRKAQHTLPLQVVGTRSA